jgi:hypothetical protein
MQNGVNEDGSGQLFVEADAVIADAEAEFAGVALQLLGYCCPTPEKVKSPLFLPYPTKYAAISIPVAEIATCFSIARVQFSTELSSSLPPD